VKDDVGSLHERVDELAVPDVALDDLQPRVRRRLGEVRAPPADEVVDDDDLTDTAVEDLVDQRRADRSRSAGDEDPLAFEVRGSVFVSSDRDAPRVGI
jgi:hypothetical protein